jgi:uncharacterized protein YbjT (DUF2867 family)
VEVVAGDYGDLDAFKEAVNGVDGVFLMNQGADVEPFRQLLATIKAQGSTKIVFLSTLLAADPDSSIGRIHKAKEDAIRASGLPGKFLRPGGFMSNTYQWIGSIKAEGVVQNPMATGKFPPIAPEDIASVAVKALTDPNLEGEEFELTGGELITVPEEVNILSEILGKAIRCVDITIEAAVQNLICAGIPAPIAAGVGRSFEMVRNGQGIAIRATVQKVTGKAPTTFREWAVKHAARFA